MTSFSCKKSAMSDDPVYMSLLLSLLTMLASFKFYFDISDVQDINVGNNTIRNVLQDSKAQVYGIILLYMSHSFRNMDFCHLANCQRNVYGVHLGWINK